MTKILLAQRLNRTMREMIKRWDAGKLTEEELAWYTGILFYSDERREIFLRIENRATKYREGFPLRGKYLDVSPLHSREFREMFTMQLWNDWGARWKEQHEVLSMAAWLAGPDEQGRRVTERAHSLGEAFE